MLSPPLDLACRQHGVRSASSGQPASLEPRLAGSRRGRTRDHDPTSASTGTSGFGA